MHKTRPMLSVVLAIIVVLAYSIILGWIFYTRAEAIMSDQLRARLKNIAVTSAVAFRDIDLNAIHGPEDIESKQYIDAVMLLNDIRAKNVGIRFSYIFRPTKDSETFEFVADADSLHPYDKVDLNNDGVIDDSDTLAPPGTPYDISRLPSIQVALTEPSTTDEPYTDQWGTYMSGFAPIRDRRGVFMGVIGVDMNIAEYSTIAQGIFSPLIFLLFLLAGGAIAAFVGFTVTNRRMESLRTLETERSGLLRMTFHELGGPIAILRLSIESMKDKLKKHSSVAHELAQESESLQKAADSINSILESLTLADHVHSDTLPYAASDVSLQSFIARIQKDAHAILHDKHQTLSVGRMQDVTLHVDQQRLTDVMLELIKNASAFSERDAVIFVEAAVEGKSVRISVRDQGHGIPKDDISRLFHEFTRASNAARMHPDGTGLGLYICKGIVERAGGKISLVSEEWKGTTVSFTVPLA